jgi:Spy/CpxP family protein refolding chaperone
MKSKLMPILAASAIFTLALPLAANACGNKENLTQAQRTQIEEVKNNARSQVEAVLTPQQQGQFQSAVQDGQKMRSAVANLNLSQEQQTQINEIMEVSKEQKRAIYRSN